MIKINEEGKNKSVLPRQRKDSHRGKYDLSNHMGMPKNTRGQHGRGKRARPGRGQSEADCLQHGPPVPSPWGFEQARETPRSVGGWEQNFSRLPPALVLEPKWPHAPSAGTEIGTWSFNAD